MIAVEPVPDNAALIARNADLSGVNERVTIIQGAADGPGVQSTNIAWNWDGGISINASGHRFIGGLVVAQSDTTISHDELACSAYSIGSLLAVAQTDRFAFCKIDCEGCEAHFLDDPLVSQLDLIVGEYHPPYIDIPGLHRLLDATHDVTATEPGPGHFRAIRKADR